MAKKRTIIILFIIVFIFLAGQTQSIDEPIQGQAAEPDKIEYKAEDSRDPFQEEKIEIEEALETDIEAKPLPNLEVQGIVWGGAFPQAIINNKVVKIGDRIDEVKVIDIAKSRVTVLFENRKYNLSAPLAPGEKSPDPKGGKDEALF